MPAILDNLERANVVVTRSGDLPDIFGRDSTPASAYDDHIKFYCPNMFNVGPDGVLTFFSGDAAHTSQAPGFDNSLQAHSAMLAGVVMALLDAGATPAFMDSLIPAAAATICKSATAHNAGINAPLP